LNADATSGCTSLTDESDTSGEAFFCKLLPEDVTVVESLVHADANSIPLGFCECWQGLVCESPLHYSPLLESDMCLLDILCSLIPHCGEKSLIRLVPGVIAEFSVIENIVVAGGLLNSKVHSGQGIVKLRTGNNVWFTGAIIGAFRMVGEDHNVVLVVVVHPLPLLLSSTIDTRIGKVEVHMWRGAIDITHCVDKIFHVDDLDVRHVLPACREFCIDAGLL